MEFNKEVFENEEDYWFEVSTCAIHKIILENQPCNKSEILIVAKHLLPNEMYEFLRKEIETVLYIGRMLNMIKYKHNVYAITDLGIGEMNLIHENINIEHSFTIKNSIHEMEIDVDKDKKIIRMVSE